MIKQLFKLLLIVLFLIVLLYAGYRYAESKNLFVQTPEIQKFGRAVERAAGLGADALRKGKELKQAVDTLTAVGTANRPQHLHRDSLSKKESGQEKKSPAF